MVKASKPWQITSKLDSDTWQSASRLRLRVARQEARRRYDILRRYERGAFNARAAAVAVGIDLRSFFRILVNFRTANGSIESLQRNVRRLARRIDERRAKERIVRTIWGAHWRERSSLRLITKKVLSLENLRLRVAFLDQFWGNRRWKGFPGIVGRLPVSIVSHGRYLTRLFGNDKWRGYPTLFSQSENNLTAKAAFFTTTLGHRKWRRYPGIFGKSIKTLQGIADCLTQTYGAQWKSCPAIFTRSQVSLEKRTKLLNSLYSSNLIRRFPLILYCVREERIRQAVKKLIRARDDWDEHLYLLERVLQGRKIPR